MADMAPKTDNKSQFVAFFQNGATSQNNKPTLKGSLTLPSGQEYSLALWSGSREDGKGLYLNGQATAQDVGQALKDKHSVNDNAARAGVPPVGLDLQRGHIVLFETPAEQMKDNDKRPNFYGYVHTAEGFFRIAAWNRKGRGPMLSGTIDINQPRPDSAADPEASVPAAKGGRTSTPAPGQGTGS